MKTIEFFGHTCVEIYNESLSLLVTRSVGPRIIALKLNGGENLLAELPSETLDCPGKGKFSFYGGHRLWHAPEDPRRTYLPDDEPVEIVPIENSLHTRQTVEPETGILKEMKVQMDPRKPIVQVEHLITNHGLWPVTCAPWAITQLKTGGIAIFPQNTELWEENPTLPNRPIILWPYTDIRSSRIMFENTHIQIRADLHDEQLKIGFPNPRGWLAYWVDETLFVKRAEYQSNATYYDFGASSECYCDHRFIELETLGPIVTLKPGDTASHTEIWEVYPNVTFPKNVEPLIQDIENGAG